ncbi:MAG: acyltransferase family protein [Clostridia bacterium]|nr:acyltransferase family protein [Clostridia bacterium]
MNKNDAKMVQGLSVLAMVCLHLFCRVNWAELYATPVMLFGLPVSFYFGQISDFCVFGFALCSGYAHMTLYGKPHYYRGRLVSLLALYGRFWLILLLFTIAAAFVGKSWMYLDHPVAYLLTVTSVIPSYNGAWWYLPVYAVLVLASPLLMKWCRKYHWLLLSFFIAVFYVVGYYLRFKKAVSFSPYFSTESIGKFLMTLAEYLFGAVLYKLSFFEKAKAAAQKIKPALFWLGSAVLIAALMLVRAKFLRTLFVAPLTGMILITILVAGQKPKPVSDFFLFFGGHSTNIWLTHMFFIRVLFTDFVFIAKYPPLIFLFMLALCLALSYAINFLYHPLQKKILRLNDVAKV